MSGGGEHLKDEGTRFQVVSAGAVAGLISRFCIAPLDVLKIRLQLQIHSLGDPLDVHRSRKGRPSTVETFKEILKGEGVTAFWKGNVPAELLYITYGAVQFSTYRLTSSILHPLHAPDGVEAFISGAAAGASATTLTYPLDLLRTRFAAQVRDPIYPNLRSAVRTITREEGFQGFFQGLNAAVSSVVPYMGLFFCAYEILRPPLAVASLPFGSGDATAGIIAGVLAKTGTFPLDLIRKRLQIQGPSRVRYAGGRVPLYGKNVWKTGTMIVKREGWKGLYRGLGVGLTKSAPASAITMWTYERALKLMKDYEASMDGE